MLCDTHIHLLAPEWSTPPEQRIRAATAAGIGFLLQPGVRVGDWEAMLNLARQHPQVYAAPGVHPLYAEQWDAAVAHRLRTAVRRPKVVAIGEIGLDKTATAPLGTQEKVLRAQLELALECELPVLLHGRGATGKLLAILGELHIGERIGGIWHGFSGSPEVASRLVAMGFAIGVGPVLLRANVRKLPAAIAQLPDQALVLETDAPDMADRPETLLEVAAQLARLKGWTPAHTAHITTATARALFLGRNLTLNTLE